MVDVGVAGLAEKNQIRPACRVAGLRDSLTYCTARTVRLVHTLAARERIFCTGKVSKPPHLGVIVVVVVAA